MCDHAGQDVKPLMHIGPPNMPAAPVPLRVTRVKSCVRPNGRCRGRRRSRPFQPGPSTRLVASDRRRTMRHAALNPIRFSGESQWIQSRLRWLSCDAFVSPCDSATTRCFRGEYPMEFSKMASEPRWHMDCSTLVRKSSDENNKSIHDRLTPPCVVGGSERTLNLGGGTSSRPSVIGRTLEHALAR